MCETNFTGSAGAMKTRGISTMFSHLALEDIQYTNITVMVMPRPVENGNCTETRSCLMAKQLEVLED